MLPHQIIIDIYSLIPAGTPSLRRGDDFSSIHIILLVLSYGDRRFK
jgi:hypothetical protein